VGGAQHAYVQASRFDPTYMPAQAGLAKVAAARGRNGRAIHLMQMVVRAYPTPEYVIWFGDLLRTAGRPDQAAQEDSLVEVENRLFQANGVNVDLEVALYDADHGKPVEALSAAQAEWTRRHSIHVADALGWALYANGRSGEALRYANRALALGTRSALFLFHRGMIHVALGQVTLARSDLVAALAVNPDFSLLWSQRATSTLSSLGA
jgi:Flp pilus assembly protein TadD